MIALYFGLGIQQGVPEWVVRLVDLATTKMDLHGALPDFYYGMEGDEHVVVMWHPIVADEAYPEDFDLPDIDGVQVKDLQEALAPMDNCYLDQGRITIIGEFEKHEVVLVVAFNVRPDNIDHLPAMYPWLKKPIASLHAALKKTSASTPSPKPDRTSLN
jgi:hypothetical protein